MPAPLLQSWDPQQYGKVAILKGGTSSEREVSLQSGNAVARACTEIGLNTVELDLGENPIAQLNDTKPDWTFNIIHGGYGENGYLNSALELMNIRHCSSSPLGMSLAMDKHITKSLWKRNGIPTPEWLILNRQTVRQAKNAIAESGINLPLVIKPVDEGSSVGLYIIENNTELDKALEESLKNFNRIMVESKIEGDEITIGILGNTSLPVIKIVPDKGIYDYNAKYISDNTKMLIPTGLGEKIEAKARELALHAFTTIHCSVWGRVDAIVNKNGDIFFIEANTLPGMTSHSLVPFASAHQGLDFNHLIMKIFQTAWEYK